MSLKSKRICKCCGKEYEYCPHCGSKSDEQWKNLTDTKECLAVFNIVAAYNVGRVTAEQVRKVLSDNNITDYSTYNPAIVATLDKINKPAKASVKHAMNKTTAIDETPKKDEEPVSENLERVTEPMEVRQPKYTHENVSRKNRYGKKKHIRNTDIEL